MNIFTIQQLQQMHESESRVTGTRQAQDAIGQLESDIYRNTTIRPEIYELYDEENRRVLVIEVPSRPIGKVFKFEDVPLMRVGEELKPMSDAMYLKILQESEPDFSEKICEGLTLDDLDEEAIRVMNPVNDIVKLLQLTERQKKIYHIIKDGTIDDTVNVPINASGLAAMFNVSEKTIKRDLYVLRDLNLIKYAGSNKTGHWEVVNQ